jgi:L-arabinose isomerase
MADYRPKVGLLGLTLEFYESLAPAIRVERDAWVRRDVLPALAPHARVEYPGAAFRAADIEARIRAFEASGCEAILVILLTYSTSHSSIQALQAARIPILIWNTQELYAITPEFGSAELTANHGVHGTFDLANVLLRAGVRFDYVTSHLRDPGGLAELAGLLRAAAAVTQLRHMRLGVLGHPFPGMGDFGVDLTYLRSSLGPVCETITMNEYRDVLASCKPAAVKELAAQYQKDYQVDSAVTGPMLEAAARAELALRTLIRQYELDAYSYQFLAFGKDRTAETIPFVAACRLMSEGVGFGGEGDVVAAAFAGVLNRMCTPAGFSEIFTIDFGNNSLLLAHMGEANPAMAWKDHPIRLKKRGELVKVTEGQLVLTFNYQPGPATLAVLRLGENQRWGVVVSLMDFPNDPPFPCADTPQALIRPRTDVRNWLTAYAKAGGPHHLAVAQGDARSALKALAGWVGADYIEI